MADPRIELSPSEAIEKFQQLLADSPSWAKLRDSQLIEHLAIFASWQYRSALWRLERARQEAFLSTAINRSSVLAGAEDNGYLPRLATPSRGQVAFTNKAADDVVVLAGSTWLLPDQTPVQVVDNVVVPAGSYAVAEARQTESRVITATIEATKAFYEILIDKALTPSISSLSVRVDTGSGLEAWELAPRLMNTTPDGKVFDQFYTALDQLGIRFGDGTFGMIPPLGATVEITLSLTLGPVEVAQGQRLTRLTDGTGDPLLAQVEATTYTTIVGGQAQEDVESIRRNALYYPLYDEQLVWRDDYAFQIRRIWPEAIWVNVWGEQEMERVHGFNFAHINKVFVTAWAPDNLDIGAEIVERLARPTNRSYVFIPPTFRPFTAEIEAVIPRTVPIAKAKEAIRATLLLHYGRDSRQRRDTIRLKDFYALINATGLFADGGHFTVELAGTTTPNGLEELVYLDADALDPVVSYG